MAGAAEPPVDGMGGGAAGRQHGVDQQGAARRLRLPSGNPREIYKTPTIASHNPGMLASVMPATLMRPEPTM